MSVSTKRASSAGNAPDSARVTMPCRMLQSCAAHTGTRPGFSPLNRPASMHRVVSMTSRSNAALPLSSPATGRSTKSARYTCGSARPNEKYTSETPARSATGSSDAATASARASSRANPARRISRRSSSMLPKYV